MTETFASLARAQEHDMPCDLRGIGITKRYAGFVLQDVSLDLPRGSVVGLIGRNGAGKTTLMRALLGAIHIDAGRVEIFGRDASGLSDREVAELKTRVAYVSAVTALPRVMTVAQAERLYAFAYPTFDRAAFAGLATRMQLPPGSGKRAVRDLSRGMGMKLQLACALASGADILVLDEPTAGLDPIVREEVLDALRAWMEQDARSLLISSHVTSDLERIADNLVLIEDGRVLLSCERDRIDAMGVARLRSVELERVEGDGLLARGETRVLRHDLSCDLLVPDRAAFLRAYPDLVCDRASIDDVMILLVKGEVR